MAVLQSTNVQGTLCVNGVAVGGGKDFKYCCFTASTSWTPSQDLVDGDGAINALVVGGGGAGGSTAQAYSCVSFNCQQAGFACTPAGGGGASWNSWLPITATDACTVTVGAGGLSGRITDPNFGPGNEPNISTCFRDGGTAAGDSTFAGKTGKAGGNGIMRIRAVIQGDNNQNARNYSCTCGGTLNYGDRFGGGAESFHYAFAGCSTSQNCFGNKTALENEQNLDYVTGSGTQYAVFDGDLCFPNNGQGAPTFTGAGGNNAAAGGGICVNLDYYSPNGRISGVKSSTSSVQLPTSSFFGIGGNGERFCYYQQFACCAMYNTTAANGNPGIVVLTWYE